LAHGCDIGPENLRLPPTIVIGGPPDRRLELRFDAKVTAETATASAAFASGDSWSSSALLPSTGCRGEWRRRRDSD